MIPPKTSIGRLILTSAGLLLSLLGMCRLAAADAAEAGSIRGVVFEAANNINLSGAKVTLEGTGRTTTTDSSGEFRFASVEAGAQTLRVSYLGAGETVVTVEVASGKVASVSIGVGDDQVVELQDFKVTGYAGEQITALNQQRQSDTISNIISADSIGEMPDDNLRQALNRLPGVNVAGGDNGQVSIRGMEGKLNSIVLDGDAMASASVNLTGFGSQGESRGLDLMKIPAEAIQGIEVIKVPTADLDADFIGGRVDLKTGSAFDFRERVARVTAEYKTFEYGGEGYGLTATYGDVLNEARTLGFFVNLSWRDMTREFGQHNLDYANPEDSYDRLAPVLNEINPNQQYEEDKTLAVNTALDWKASEATTLSFKAWYNGSKRLDMRDRVQIQVRDITADNLETEDGLTASGSGRIRVRKRHRYRPDRDFEQVRLSLKGTTDLENGQLAYGLSYGGSWFTAHEYEYLFEHQTSRSTQWSYDRTQSLAFPTLTFTNSETVFNDPSVYSPGEATQVLRDNSDNDITGSLDYTHNFATSKPLTLKTGLKARSKNRSQDGYVRFFNGRSNFRFSDIALRQFSTYGRFKEYGFVGDDRDYLRYFKEYQSDTSRFVENATRGAQEDAQSQQEIDENIYAAYAMLTSDLGKLRLIGGLRYEYTDASYSWPASRANREAMEFPDVTSNVSYGTAVPSFIANYRFTEKDVLRFGYSRPLARPDWNSLVPVDQSITYAVTDPDELAGGSTVEVNMSNPDLNPQRSDNLDLAFEHYYGPGNLISIGVFYKKMDNYIGAPISRLSDEQASDPLTGDPIYTTDGDPVYFVIMRPENGVSQEVTGLELNWQHRFTSLPWPLSGLGVNTNYAFIDGTRTAPLFEDPSDPYRVTGYKKFDRLEAQPDTIFHGQVFWEGKGFNVRLGFTQTGNQVDQFDRDGDADYIRDVLKSIDVQAGYEFSNGWKLFVEGKNLTNEPVDTRFYETRNYLATYDLDGTEWTFGVRARF